MSSTSFPQLNNLERKILKGKILYEDICDLHGMRYNPAMHYLQNFLTRSFMQHYRIVCVISGKGSYVLYELVLRITSSHPKIIKTIPIPQKAIFYVILKS